MPRLRVLSLVVLFSGFVLFAAACGDSDGSAQSTEDGSGASSDDAEPSSEEGGDSEGSADGDAAGIDTSVKPVISVPGGAAPAELVIEDLVVGDGAEATAGSTVDVDYAGVAWSNGEEFDASWNRGQPFSFNLGAGGVIQGWDEGVAGMKVGGRRQLTIPPGMAYGDTGAGGGLIAPGETLIFVVDLRAVN